MINDILRASSHLKSHHTQKLNSGPQPNLALTKQTTHFQKPMEATDLVLWPRSLSVPIPRQKDAEEGKKVTIKQQSQAAVCRSTHL